jgi:hypothetical protein
LGWTGGWGGRANKVEWPPPTAWRSGVGTVTATRGTIPAPTTHFLLHILPINVHNTMTSDLATRVDSHPNTDSPLHSPSRERRHHLKRRITARACQPASHATVGRRRSSTLRTRILCSPYGCLCASTGLCRNSRGLGPLSWTAGVEAVMTPPGPRSKSRFGELPAGGARGLSGVVL